MALKLKLKRKHNRNIITKFLRCEEIVQKEIMLRQAVKDIEISDKSINDAIEHIQKDFEREGFGKINSYSDQYCCYEIQKTYY